MQKTDGLVITGHEGTWYVLSTMEFDGENIFLLESEEHGDMAACLVVRENLELLFDDEWNGFDDYLEMKECEADEDRLL